MSENDEALIQPVRKPVTEQTREERIANFRYAAQQRRKNKEIEELNLAELKEYIRVKGEEAIWSLLPAAVTRNEELIFSKSEAVAMSAVKAVYEMTIAKILVENDGKSEITYSSEITEMLRKAKERSKNRDPKD